MSCIRKVALIIIHENSQVGCKGRNARQAIDILERKNNFTSQFGTYTEYAIPDGYFEVGGKDRKSQFDWDCNKILDTFIKFRRDMQGVKKITTNVLSELNRVYTNEASTSFTDALVKTKSAGVEKKKSQNERRKDDTYKGT